MASLEQRGKRFRIVIRFGGSKLRVNIRTANRKEAEACLARLEDNLRLVD